MLVNMPPAPVLNHQKPELAAGAAERDQAMSFRITIEESFVISL
jgi:hypothetical protein